MRKPARFVLLLALLSPVGAMALGLGNIKLNSALNQPLDAEIALVAASPSELESLGISLASADAFASYGLDRPAYLLGMRFRIVKDGSGGAVIKVTTDQAVREPFVTFLVEADWARGRLLREYTVLLDPPVFMKEEPAPTPRSTPATTQPASGAVSREPVTPSPAPQPVTPVAQPPAQTAPATASRVEGMSTRYGPIRRNETLWTIANRIRPDRSVSINQMMIALFRENPQAFVGNINRLRQGAVLRVPTRADISALSSNEAFAEVRRQNAAWRGSRPASAAASAAPSGAGAGRASGAGTSGRLRLVPPGDAAREQAARTQSGEDTAVADSELAGNRALTQRIQSLEGELENARRLIDVKDSELSALQARLEALESRLAEESAAAESGVDVTAAEDGAETAAADATADAAADAVTETGTEATDVAGEPEATAADAAAEEAVTDVAQPPPAVVTPPVEGKGFFGRIIDFFASAWIWILGALAVALAGAFFFLMRDRSGDGETADSWETGEWKAPDSGATAEFAAVPEVDTETHPAPKFEKDESFVVVEAEDTISEEALKPPPAAEADDFAAALGDAFDDTGTFTPGELEVEKAEQAEALDDDAADYPFEDTMIGHDALKLDESDPVAEADFHMAYGLYDQAAALVERAVEKNPDSRELKMKLMEIFFVWGNKDRFLEEAQAFKGEVGDAGAGDWEKIAIMGKQLIPDSDIFVSTEATGVFSAPDLEFSMEDEDTSATATDLDFIGGDDQNVVDFGLGDEGDVQSEEGADDLSALKEKIDNQIEPSEETLDLGSSHLDLDLDLEASADGDANEESTAVNEGIADADMDAGALIAAADGTLDEDLEIDLDFKFEDVGDDEPTAVLEDVDTDDIEEMLANVEGDADAPVQEVSAGSEGADDETRQMDTSDFDPFGDEGDLTAESPLAGADDHAATMQMPRIDLNDDDVNDLVGGSDEEATRQIEQVSQDFGGDETVQIARSTDAVPDDDATVQTRFGDANSDLTTQLPGAGANGQDFAGAGDEGDDFDEEPTQKLQALDLPESSELDEVGTKLDLAKAFVDMGDPDGARNILHEVLDEGNDSQREEAKSMLDNLG